MKSTRSQAGEGRLGCLFWVLLIAAGTLVGFKVVPVRVHHAQLQDFMIEQAQFAATATSKQITQSILDRAHDLDLPLDKKNLKVEKRNGQVRIEAEYTVTLDFAVYQHEWTMDHDIDRPYYRF